MFTTQNSGRRMIDLLPLTTVMASTFQPFRDLFNNTVHDAILRGYRPIQCMKLFFGYSKYHSVTYNMLIELGLPSFDTLIVNSRVRLSHQCQSTQNGIIGHICRL